MPSRRLFLAVSIATLVLVLVAYLAIQQLIAKNEPSTHPAVEHPEVAGKRLVYREVLSPPVEAYEFRGLVDGSGRIVSLSDFRGKIVVLGFIYTSCPDVCPLFTSNYLYIQQKLSRSIGRDVVLIFITTDPERDDVETVRHYTEAYGGRWFFLTGPREKLSEVWEAYDVFVEAKQEPRGIVVYHSYKTYVIDRQGKIRIVYTGLYNPADLVRDLLELMEAS